MQQFTVCVIPVCGPYNQHITYTCHDKQLAVSSLGYYLKLPVHTPTHSKTYYVWWLNDVIHMSFNGCISKLVVYPIGFASE